ncbi:TIGR03067 domain-containing protein [Stieleria varia]|uniref:TIGR03067 domain-containing protein n=1 Tax=Stieleria varia TaxID=2528005 RepID=A0A5C6B3J3_9BACT|nr:TIGR03067 domain-containing protein [Stieleria varia]TWU06327.1 hypothetical protein Pla52n_20480 [Stieleria varia]
MSKYLLVIPALAALLVVSPVATAQEAKQEAKRDSISSKLQGRWEIVGGVNQGRDLSAAELDGTYVTVARNTIITFDRQDKQRYRAVFRLDESMSPIHITMTSVPEHPPSNELKSVDQVDNAIALGILKFDGQRKWTLCYALPGTDRPEKFESPKGSKVMLFMLEKKQGDPVPSLKETDPKE